MTPKEKATAAWLAAFSRWRAAPTRENDAAVQEAYATVRSFQAPPGVARPLPPGVNDRDEREILEDIGVLYPHPRARH